MPTGVRKRVSFDKMMGIKNYGLLTADELEKLTNNIVIIPVGSLEPHGPHLPLATDTLIAEELAKELAKEIDCITFPPVYFGIIDYFVFLKKGGIFIKDSTFTCLIEDVLRSLAKRGFKKILLLNGHGTNIPILHRVSERVALEEGIKVLVFTYYKAIAAEIACKTGHAGTDETSVIMYINKELFRREKAIAGKYGEKVNGFQDFPQSHFNEIFVDGDPLVATEEIGKEIIKKAISKLIPLVEKHLK